jgi:acetyl esterase/lipase
MLTRRLMLASSLAAAGCATMSAGEGVASIETFDLWPGAPPGGENVTAVETIIERSTTPGVRDRAVTHVRKPTLKVFRPARPDGSAVLVIPGGGYQRVVLDKEGDETALRLAAAGVTCGVLIYRLPEDGWAADRDVSLQDAQRAIRLMRSGRVASGLVAGRTGVLGFSAGGHLAASLSLRSEVQTYAPVDDADRQPARPDFSVLVYAAVAASGPSPGRRQVIPALSTLVTPQSPPMFLLHASDDTTVPVQGTVDMFNAAKAAGVPAELHIFPEGSHGFGIAKAAGKPIEVWPDLLLRWGRERGMFRG